jgi:hypothetical protein
MSWKVYLIAAALAATGTEALAQSSETPPPPLTAVEFDTLANEAKDFLTEWCGDCHDGTLQGRKAFVGQLQNLEKLRLVRPGRPFDSEIYRRITDEDDPMPPGKGITLPAEKLDLIERWIAAGAPVSKQKESATSRTLTLEELEADVLADLKKMNDPERAKHTRYFTLHHLENRNTSPEGLATVQLALSKLLNSLSWHPELVRPEAVGSTTALLRIDLRSLKWDAATWEAILDANPYAVVRTTEAAREVRAMTRTDVPILQADWFVMAASLSPLYEKILSIPETEEGLRQKLQLDVDANRRNGSAAFAGFRYSGVSNQNRIIERHPTPWGAYWKSYDFSPAASKEQIIFLHPLGGDGRPDGFKHAGGEIIFNLPNGLQAYMLATAAGQRLPVAPHDIVKDEAEADATVKNARSCMRCHSGGIILKVDEVREKVLEDEELADLREEVQRLYKPREEMLALQKQDLRRFREAARHLGISSFLPSVEPIAQVVRQFEEDVDLKDVATELGVTPDALKVELQKKGPLRAQWRPLLGKSILRSQFIAYFDVAVEALKLGTPLRKFRAEASPPVP